MIALPVLNRFLNWAVVGLGSPVLVLLAMGKGIEVGDIGFAMAIMSAAVVLFELPSGVLADLVGRRKVYLLSLAIAIAARVFLLRAQGFAAVSLCLAAVGTARAFSSGTIEADFIDDFIERRGRDRLPRLVSAMNAAEGAGLALGALAGGWLPSLRAANLVASDDYDGNILAQIALLLVLALLTLGTGRGKRGGQVRDASPARLLAESRDFLRSSPAARLLLGGAAVWGFLFTAIEVFWQPRLQEIVGGGGTWIFGLVNAGYFVAAMLGSLAVGAFWMKGPGASLAFAAALRLGLCLSVAALSLQSSVAGFSSAFLAIMAFNGAMNVPEGTVLNAILPGDKRASFLSLSSLATQLGGIVGSLAFGFAKRYLSFGSIWLLAALVFLGSVPLYRRAASSASIALDPRASPRSSS